MLLITVAGQIFQEVQIRQARIPHGDTAFNHFDVLQGRLVDIRQAVQNQRTVDGCTEGQVAEIRDYRILIRGAVNFETFWLDSRQLLDHIKWQPGIVRNRQNFDFLQLGQVQIDQVVISTDIEL